MATKWYTKNQVAKIIKAAQKFVDASLRGETSVTVGKVTHRPRETGMCARFVRECVEAGLGLAEYAWLDPDPATANEMAAQLRARGYSIGDTVYPLPGDILWRPAGAYGHIALYVGTDVPGHERVCIIAENTSSGKRGIPQRAGTKYTRRGTIAEGCFGEWREVFRLTKPGVG